MEIAVVIPCFNEDKTIFKVVNDFKKELPNANIYVFDNNSTDNSVELALKAGAIIKKEFIQGKGAVIKNIFSSIQEDICIIVDGDDTYNPKDVHLLIKNISNNYDMVIADRLSNGIYAKQNTRLFHNFGNKLVRFIINFLFKSNLNDIMSGYRAFSKKFRENIKINVNGFEIETFMTIYALKNNIKIIEIPSIYKNRPEGSFSKLNTFIDGFKVLKTIFKLWRNK